MNMYLEQKPGPHFIREEALPLLGLNTSSKHYDFLPTNDPQSDNLRRALLEIASPVTIYDLVDTSSAFLPSVETKIGGMPFSSYGEEWPTCSNSECCHPMKFVFQMKDPEVNELHVFYHCSSCAKQDDQWEVRSYIHPSMNLYCEMDSSQPGSVELKSFIAKESQNESIPSWNEIVESYDSIYEACCEVSSDKPEEAYVKAADSEGLVIQSNDSSMYSGGFQPFESSTCPDTCSECKRENEFFAHIPSRKDGFCWPNNKSLTLARCPAHTNTFTCSFS